MAKGCIFLIVRQDDPSITFGGTRFILLEWIRFFCVICIPSPHGNCLWLTGLK